MKGVVLGGTSSGVGKTVATLATLQALDAAGYDPQPPKAGMQSVGATALGFTKYAAHAGFDIDVAGVVAQRAHGGRHADGIREALPDDIAYLGRIPPTPGLEVPDRHLGLEMGGESPLDDLAARATEGLPIYGECGG